MDKKDKSDHGISSLEILGKKVRRGELSLKPPIKTGKRGRPKKPNAMKARVTIWLSEEERRTLTERSRGMGISISELIRRLYRPDSILDYVPDHERVLAHIIVDAIENEDFGEAKQLVRKQHELFMKYLNYFLKEEDDPDPISFKFRIATKGRIMNRLSAYYHVTEHDKKMESERKRGEKGGERQLKEET
ncbi:MAG: hypothetical protein GTO24_15925 [candidate division Zixibacteria bacterium]|nr:hypothetical protein [candidate division Zixibacteria bacterium]